MIVECDCGKRLKVDDSKAGLKIRCPGCQGVLTVGSADDEFESPRSSQSKAPPSSPRRKTNRKSADESYDEDEFEPYEADEDWDLDDDPWEEDDEYEERPRRRRSSGRRSRESSGRSRGRRGGGRSRRQGRGRDDGDGRPGRCPDCGSRDYKKVGWTLWGGIIGPVILSHVKCLDCRSTFNRKTGRSNQTAITIFVIVSFAIGGVMAGFAFCAGLAGNPGRRVEVLQPNSPIVVASSKLLPEVDAEEGRGDACP